MDQIHNFRCGNQSLKKKNSKGTAKNRSKANTDGNSTASAAGSGAIDASLLYLLPEHHTIRNNLTSKYGVNYTCYLHRWC